MPIRNNLNITKRIIKNMYTPRVNFVKIILIFGIKHIMNKLIIKLMKYFISY